MKRNKPPREVTVSFKCPENLAQELAQLAKAQELNRSQFIRKLIKKELLAVQ